MIAKRGSGKQEVSTTGAFTRLLRGLRRWPAIVLSAAIFSIIHFLKAPDQTTTVVQWNSGFVSLAHSFDQFGEPMLVLISKPRVSVRCTGHLSAISSSLARC